MARSVKDRALTELEELLHPLPEYLPDDIRQLAEQIKLYYSRDLRDRKDGSFQCYILSLYDIAKDYFPELKYENGGAPKTHWSGHYLPLMRAIRDVFEDNKIPVDLVDLPEADRRKIVLGKIHSILQFDGTYTLETGDEVCILAMKKKGALKLRKSAIGSVCGNAVIDEESDNARGDMAVTMDYRLARELFGNDYYDKRIEPNVTVHLPIGIRSLPTGLPKCKLPKPKSASEASKAEVKPSPIDMGELSEQEYNVDIDFVTLVSPKVGQLDVELVVDEFKSYDFKPDYLGLVSMVDDVAGYLRSRVQNVVRYPNVEYYTETEFLDEGLFKKPKRAYKRPKRAASKPRRTKAGSANRCS